MRHRYVSSWEIGHSRHTSEEHLLIKTCQWHSVHSRLIFDNLESMKSKNWNQIDIQLQKAPKFKFFSKHGAIVCWKNQLFIHERNYCLWHSIDNNCGDDQFSAAPVFEGSAKINLKCQEITVLSKESLKLTFSAKIWWKLFSERKWSKKLLFWTFVLIGATASLFLSFPQRARFKNKAFNSKIP